MLIADGQIHLWEKGTPSPQHRQEPYSAEPSLQHIADPELTADLPGVDGLVWIGERGVAGNYQHACNP